MAVPAGTIDGFEAQQRLILGHEDVQALPAMHMIHLICDARSRGLPLPAAKNTGTRCSAALGQRITGHRFNERAKPHKLIF